MALLIIEANDDDELLEYADFKYTKNAHREVFDLIKLVQWSIKVNPSGVLIIKKETMRGSEPIEAFYLR
ncbi:MAG: hypothetical protein RR439_06340 [Carnobacterium sp.]